MALTIIGSTPPFSAPLMRHMERAASRSAASRPLSDTASSNSSLRAAGKREKRKRGRDRKRERERKTKRERDRGGEERETE